MRTVAAPTRAMLVLIASKHEWASRSLESVLAPRGYAVLKTYTSQDTLERAQRAAPDAIIIDDQLPDTDAHALCRELRARALVSASTPILIMVARVPTRRDRCTALRAGAWDCLGQPPDAEELLAILEAFVPAKLDADQARAAALIDETTGLYNIRGLTQRAHELGSLATRYGAALACVLLAPEPSPDGAVESARHSIVIRRVGYTLRTAGRLSDAIGRVGSGAFAVVASDTDAIQARALAQRLADAILAAPESSFRVVGGCHGVSDCRAASIDPVELMLCATTALQKARAEPARGWLRWFDEGEAPYGADSSSRIQSE
jgi:two-component system, OmpR family, alkaline phosphatase synthesis response regulator PhoP